MNFYKTKKNKLAGSSFHEVNRSAQILYKQIRSETKRTPYIRSKYFKNEKVFLAIFWSHLFEKHEWERTTRLKFYPCAIDLIKNSTYDPVTRENFKQTDEILHRFYGKTKDNQEFVVQIKENKRSKRKDMISIFGVK